MGRGSYIALGTERAMSESFGSTCHGAGRVQSRAAAKRSLTGVEVARQLASRGITVKTGSLSSLAEEASQAYKDVNEVVEITDKAGISRRVIRARFPVPLDRAIGICRDPHPAVGALDVALQLSHPRH